MSAAPPSVVNLSATCRLRGKAVYARGSHKPVHAFLGIPYAEAPVGGLRFKAPVAKRLWHGERDCTKFGPICPQNKWYLAAQIAPIPVPEMAEDCLHLNVWTPAVSQATRLPVMLWIHGGGFITGLSDIYDGTSFASFQDVVFISINYRVAALGFMSSGDSESPGNYGLLDQVEALRWTRKYIDKFGGDPSNVTIFGESAGGISASFHMVSDMSKDLFKRAILQSGVAGYPGDVWTGQQARKYITKRAQKQGFTGSSTKELVTFLRTLSVDELVEMGEGFSPVVDGVFLKSSPLTIYKNKAFQPKECILGFNSDEGATFVFGALKKTEVKSLQEAKMYIDLAVKTAFFRGHERADHISRLIVNEYLDGVKEGDSERITRALTDFHGELLFVAPIIKLATMHSELANTYLYLFDKRPPFSRWPQWVQADHSHEIFYALGVPFNTRVRDKYSDRDKQISHTIMQYWANFARHGNPNGPKSTYWPEFDADNERFLLIGDNVHCDSKYKKQRLDFWNKTINQLRNAYKSKY